MVETATQTNPVTATEITPVTTSTPTKERMPAHTISPVKPCQGIDDPDYKPSDCSFNAEGEKITYGMVALEDVHECCGDVTSEKKYIVFHNKLMDLLQCCPICGGPSRGHVVNRMTRGYGTMVKVEHTCKGLLLHQDMGQSAIHRPHAAWQPDVVSGSAVLRLPG